MPMCKDCGDVVSPVEIKEGLCPKCATPERKLEREQAEEQVKKQQLLERDKHLKQQEREATLRNNPQELINHIWVTTETTINKEIETREIIIAQAVYGMNILKDFFAGIRDIVGGRIKSIENTMDDGKEQVLLELRKKAFLLNADAIIGLQMKLEANGSILSVTAVATAVKFKT